MTLDVSILSKYLNTEYTIDSGPNVASPSVAGAASLIKADSLQFSSNDVRIIFENRFHSLTCQGRPSIVPMTIEILQEDTITSEHFSYIPDYHKKSYESKLVDNFYWIAYSSFDSIPYSFS
jgi:hypothetical protein